MVLKENCYDVNKPPLVYRRAKKAPLAQAVKFEDFVVQTSRSDEISELSAQFEERDGYYSEDEDSDNDDIMSRVESVVATAAKIKKRMGKLGPTAVEKTRRPLQKLQQEDNERSTNLDKKASKLPKTVALTREENSINAEVSRLHSSCSHLSALDLLGDDTSSEIQALADQANLLVPTQHQLNDPEGNKTEEIILLVKELAKQSVMVRALTSHNEDAMRQISSFEQLVREKDQEIEDSKYYNDMNDCANKRLLTFATERHERLLNEQKQRVANLVKIIQRQQLGGSEHVNSLIREKCMLQEELSIVKRHLNEEALLDKQHLKRVQCAVAVTALVSAYVALAVGLDSYVYIAPFYFLFVFFVVA